ncbi:phosphorylase / glycogen(starch) synthase [Chitinophaga rupis]|uniref:glycogen phosphorylase n=1 Tax=Chitinophaga rupis TaxID=573321 RepID=A0A1H7PX10_9BACT|nr:alpha-glucan family phosphorylase [Chitinophaga rupis]SEL40370.1 phosphorylase / glycogen(starch) synthase [Chitinophaga rupis]
MKDTTYEPDYIFEVSWEVCNKVGGIHTVLATKARLLQERWGDRLIMIGPDLQTASGEHPEFIENKNLFTTWKAHIQHEGLRVRTGRWNIPGKPLVILIDFTPLYKQKDKLFTELWVKYRLDSLRGQWDYIEPAIFGYAAGIAIAHFYHCHLNATDKIIAQFHEWMTGAGILYLEDKIPQIATVFTTHATVLGRTLAGSGQAFYSRLNSINAEQAARDNNVVAKCSLEKTAAATADCFTCVSEFTSRECEQLLGKRADLITPNGFDDSFVPDAAQFEDRRQAARKKILAVATALLQQALPENSLLVIKSGRYEFRNKGMDVFIDSLGLLNKTPLQDKTIVAFIFVPAAHTGPRKMLLDSLDTPDLSHPRTGEILTHNLQNADTDPVLTRIRQQQLNNAPGTNVKIFFVPTYLDGADGVFNMPYYDVMIGFDLAVFPSYYEPWGYTPLESLAFHIPAVTTALSGFGATVSQLPAYKGQGMYIVARNDNNETEAAAAIAGIIREYAAAGSNAVTAARESAAALSRQFHWEQLISRYYQAYDLALQKSLQREELFRDKPQAAPVVVEEEELLSIPVWRNIQVEPALPAALQPLQNIAANIWWSWQPDAAALFAYIDNTQWELCRHNPPALINSLDLPTVNRLVNDAYFMHMLNHVHERLQQYLQAPPESMPLTAYFSMEYGIYNNLKIYAGGLGVLAGDYLKAASDSYIPLVAVGLLYREGYFKQVISPQGDQLVLPDIMTPGDLPVYPVYDSNGAPLLIPVAFPGRTVSAGVWKVQVGRVSLYLLDTDVPGNRAEDCHIAARLYNSNTELRLQQEILLGIGGVRLLASLNLQPDLYHINEGHAAFAGLERIRQLVQQSHLGFEEALEIVKAGMQFTTHTAVAAAMDTFEEAQLRAYLSYLATDLNIPWERLMAFGRADNGGDRFSMFYLAAHLSQEINAVSRLHEEISRRLLQPLWKDFKPAELHITHVTNGVHTPTWTAEKWKQGYSNSAAAADIWKIRQSLKKDMVQAIRKRLHATLTGTHENTGRILQVLDNLNAATLFIGFARRFAPYKRAQLLFTDLQRLSAIVNNSARPVQIIFAGKAHPDDGDGAGLLKQVIQASRDPRLNNRILFLEDYDMELSALLVKGVDVWLNTPRIGKEASGTSGMKAVLNGALHCSVKDGWWAEAYREDAGWALEGDNIFMQDALQDVQDASLLYSMLENEIVPRFYERNANGVPEKWIAMIRASLSEIAPSYDMMRVVKEYRGSYEKLYQRTQALRADKYALAKQLAAWKKNTRDAWHGIHVMDITLPAGDNPVQKMGEALTAVITLHIGSLAVNDVGVEVLLSRNSQADDYLHVQELEVSAVKNNNITFQCRLPLTFSGTYSYSFRIFAKHPALPHRMDFPLITWI